MHPEQEHLEFLAKGEFMLQRSRSSGTFVFYPRVAAPSTGAKDLEWVKASGLGTVYSTTIIRQKPPKVDYNLALIDLKEGPHEPGRQHRAAGRENRHDGASQNHQRRG